MSAVFVALALLLVTSKQSFVDTAPLNSGSSGDSTSAQDASVKELESLKQPLGSSLEVLKSQSTVYTNNNGQREAHAERKEEVNKNGKLLARVNQHLDFEPKEAEKPSGVQTEVEVPSQGIHKSVVHDIVGYQALTGNGNRRSPDSLGNNVDKYNSFTGIQYSPLDMAEYVFWTGDEKGVTLAIEEFLQEGLMSREEAISFLQEIKYNLDYLKNHYTQLGLNAKENTRLQETPKYAAYSKNGAADKPELRNSFNLNQLRQEVTKKREPEVTHSTMLTKTNDDKVQDEDYDELLERLRLADFLYTEYSLEEVIYQLAKVMFTQSLTRGSAEAQQALQKFTNFLEVEAEQGHISRALEKKVLDVLIASLSDTLTEHPELLSAAKETLRPTSTNSDGQHFLRQILEISPDDKAVRVALDPYKGQSERNIQLPEQMKEMKMTNHVPLGLGKYKNP